MMMRGRETLCEALLVGVLWEMVAKEMEALLSACYGSVWSVCASACQLSKLARTESLLVGVDRLKQTHAWCHTYCT